MERFAQGGFHVTYEKRVDQDAYEKSASRGPTYKERRPDSMHCWSGRTKIAGT